MIQSHLRHASLTKRKTQIARAFTRHMFEGNTRATLQLLIGQDHGSVLNLNDPADPSNPEFSVSDALNAKHPPAQPLHPECCLPSVDTPAVHPVVFNALDASLVCAAVLHTVGAAGQSGIDAHGWRRLCIYVLHSFLQIFSLHFWDAGSLLGQVSRSLAYWSL